jgi:hypothetical protein
MTPPSACASACAVVGAGRGGGARGGMGRVVLHVPAFTCDVVEWIARGVRFPPQSMARLPCTARRGVHNRARFLHAPRRNQRRPIVGNTFRNTRPRRGRCSRGTWEFSPTSPRLALGGGAHARHIGLAIVPHRRPLYRSHAGPACAMARGLAVYVQRFRVAGVLEPVVAVPHRDPPRRARTWSDVVAQAPSASYHRRRRNHPSPRRLSRPRLPPPRASPRSGAEEVLREQGLEAGEATHGFGQVKAG